MKITLPILDQTLTDGEITSSLRETVFEVDTSVYSEERWEQNFPTLAAHEGLFQYIERINKDAVTERVRVISMLKAIFCFIESEEVSTYKQFAQMFNLANVEYTDNLILKLKSAFNLILNGSSVKN
jgi:hypothetical protein